MTQPKVKAEMAETTRRAKRVRLLSPIGATIGDQKVTVVDISSVGSRLEHAFPLAVGTTLTVQFDYEGALVAVTCEVVRCKLDRSVLGDRINYTSGLNLVDPDSESAQLLMRLVSGVVKEDLDARREYAKKKK